MRLNQDCLTRCLRSLACPEVAEAVVVAVATVEVAEIVAEIEEALSPEPNRRIPETSLGVKMEVNLDTGGLAILMGLLLMGAPCTGSGGDRPSSVRSRPRVLGRTFLHPSLPNETGTSSAKIIIKTSTSSY